MTRRGREFTVAYVLWWASVGATAMGAVFATFADRKVGTNLAAGGAFTAMIVLFMAVVVKTVRSRTVVEPSVWRRRVNRAGYFLLAASLTVAFVGAAFYASGDQQTGVDVMVGAIIAAANILVAFGLEAFWLTLTGNSPFRLQLPKRGSHGRDSHRRTASPSACPPETPAGCG